jgi:hypothetical protein
VNTTIRANGVDPVAFTPAAKTKLDGDFADSYLQAIKDQKISPRTRKQERGENLLASSSDFRRPERGSRDPKSARGTAAKWLSMADDLSGLDD